MKLPWESAIDGLFDVLGQVITDKDLIAKLEVEKEKLRLAIQSELLKTQTIPWVDALIKVMVALPNVVLPLLRPLGSAAMTAAGLYASFKGVELNDAVEVAAVSAFPAWGASRHVNKQTHEKTKQVQSRHKQSLFVDED